MKPNRLKFIELMEANNLTIRQVMEALEVSYQTVKCWRCRSGKDISNNNLKLLKLLFTKVN